MIKGLIAREFEVVISFVILVHTAVDSAFVGLYVFLDPVKCIASGFGYLSGLDHP